MRTTPGTRQEIYTLNSYMVSLIIAIVTLDLYLEDLLASCPETLPPYKGICGFSGSFHGKTVFQFPLLNKLSKLSNTLNFLELYTISKLKSLLESLKAEAKYI